MTTTNPFAPDNVGKGGAVRAFAMTANPARSIALLLFTLLSLLPRAAHATTYYVATSGRDTNPGTLAAPWLTVQHAAASMVAGDTVIVAGGSYRERLTITNSGSAAGGQITYAAASGADVQLLGFQISAGYVTISGFDISTQVSGDGNAAGYGIYLYGGAAHDIIEGNNLHDLCEDGIFMTPGVSSNEILSNTINHAEMSGITVDGTGNLIAGNDISHTSQYPAKNGGIYSVCSSRSGADADWIRFFGQNNTIANNNLHDIVEPSAENKNPHTDCFQTWGSPAMTVNNIVIDANYCRGQSWFNKSGGTNHIGAIEDSAGGIGTIYFVNNVFANLYQGLIMTFNDPNQGARDFYNNTVDHIAQEALDYTSGASATIGDQVFDNIFFDSGNGGDAFTTSATPTFAQNDCVMRGGGGCGLYPLKRLPSRTLSADPQFVSDGNATGLNANYTLLATSPMIDAGVADYSLPDGTCDYTHSLITNTGEARPQGAGWDIGAYEYPD